MMKRYRFRTSARKINHGIDHSGKPDQSLPVLLVHPYSGIIKGWNVKAERLFGNGRKNLINVPCSTIFPKKNRENARVLHLLRGRIRSGRQILCSAMVTGGGKTWPAWLILDPPKKSRRSSGLIRLFIMDKDGSRQQVEYYKKANFKLNLISSATRHDITNCLFALDGYSTLLQARLNEWDPDQCRVFSAKIKNQMAKISRILAFSRSYESLGRNSPEWVDIETTILDTAGNDLRVLSDVKGLEICADPMVKMVFFTLVENAMRHGCTVTEIRAGYRCDENGCTILVQDDGTGISDERKELIFERGYGDNTGYGLYFAWQILDLNNMTIRETGAYGSGARFEIQVPAGAFRINTRMT